MGLQKGHTNNPNGRKKGTPNKVTSDFRERINIILTDNWGTIENDIKEMEPRDRLYFIEKLLRFVIPTMQATSMNIDFNRLTDEQLDEVINQLKNSNHE